VREYSDDDDNDERILFLINCEFRNIYSTSLKPMHACALFSHSLGNEEE